MAQNVPLADGFELVRKLVPGRENPGVQNAGVHIVRRTRDGAFCIKKTLRPPNRTGSSEFFDSVTRQEIDVVLALKKTKIPHLNRYIWHEKVDDEGGVDLYTRFCDLGSLESLMERYFSRELDIPEEFVWHVFESQCRALAYLHFGCNSMLGLEEQPDWDYIVHGDIKPANIFLNKHPGHRYPIIVLGDFGCSISRNQLRYMERHNNVSLAFAPGTPMYFPPERASNPTAEDLNTSGRTIRMRGLGPQSDIWALGVSLMQLMGVWHHPSFHSGDPRHGVVKTAEQVATIDDSNYTPQLRGIVKTTLVFDSRRRQQSKSLVRLIKEEFRSTVHEHGLRSLRNVQPLPQWALPTLEDAAQAPVLQSSGQRSQVLPATDSQHSRPASKEGLDPGDPPNSLRRQVAEAAIRRAQEEQQQGREELPASSAQDNAARRPSPASSGSRRQSSGRSQRRSAGYENPSVSQPRSGQETAPSQTQESPHERSKRHSRSRRDTSQPRRSRSAAPSRSENPTPEHRGASTSAPNDRPPHTPPVRPSSRTHRSVQQSIRSGSSRSNGGSASAAERVSGRSAAFLQSLQPRADAVELPRWFVQ